MQRLSFAFFTFDALCGLAGMILGGRMGSSGDHSAPSAHTHLNLLGRVGMAIMGALHALAAGRVPPALGGTNFMLSGVGAIVLPTAMLLLMGGGGHDLVRLVIAGGMSAILGMAVFLASVLVAWRRAEPTPLPT